jgi:uncharacterized iron-regulated membrane protein
VTKKVDAFALRPLAMRLHRWVALAVGAWFLLLGLTGAAMVWHGEIDRALNPRWFAPIDNCGAVAPATPIASALAIHAANVAGSKPTQVMAPIETGAAFLVWDKPGKLRRQHFVDVACARYLGARDWGAVRLDREHAVPAIYELHRSLLAGEAGHVAVGFGGLLLLFAAISGVVTAWPRQRTRANFKRVFTLKRDAGNHRRMYDLHRATGAWLFLFLALMSLTGAYLCFPKQGRAIVGAMFATSPVELRATGRARVDGSADALVRHAEALWPRSQWTRVLLPTDKTNAWDVRLLQAAEVRADTGDTRVRLRADGNVVDLRDPLRGPTGDRLIAWLFPLHSGEALGLGGRIAWTAFGLAPALLFVTGAWLWWKRRRVRKRG